MRQMNPKEIYSWWNNELFQQNKLLNKHIRGKYSILKLRLIQTEKTKGISTMIVVWICVPFSILSSFTIHEKDK